MFLYNISEVITFSSFYANQKPPSNEKNHRFYRLRKPACFLFKVSFCTPGRQ